MRCRERSNKERVRNEVFDSEISFSIFRNLLVPIEILSSVVMVSCTLDNQAVLVSIDSERSIFVNFPSHLRSTHSGRILAIPLNTASCTTPFGC